MSKQPTALEVALLEYGKASQCFQKRLIDVNQLIERAATVLVRHIDAVRDARNDGLEKAAREIKALTGIDRWADAIRALKQKPDTQHGCEGEHDAKSKKEADP